MRASFVTLCLVALSAGSAAAQTLPVDDPVLRRLWSLGMEPSDAPRQMQVLTDSIGPRLAMLAYLASEDPERTPRAQREIPAASGGPGAWPRCAEPARSFAEWTR
jgi:hypothetical protein